MIRVIGLSVFYIAVGLFLFGFVDLNTFLPKRAISGAKGAGFAVVELFTSEGCSSCPPADEVLERLQKEIGDQPIYLLAYHVDYWDRLGWKDTFSSSAYSDRQGEYGRWFNLSTIYTPQVVVNGQEEFVGTDESRIRKSILAQLVVKPSAILRLEHQKDDTGVKVTYHAEGTIKNTSLLIAIVQKSGHSNVVRGENAGRGLSHVQIVRSIQIVNLNATGIGNTSIKLPKDLDGQQWEVLGLIQDKSNGKILGAAKVIASDK
ncbi:DUF1223 domain-containing protein [Pedobacter hiemivivus]|uniref:DUF1223 domain-containing protein n=1 Tax=Pedobacter hiemivivus TaxID=2530454 RepID=A0A4R0NDI5_9SPHI|nr:DUF1223 domain-containing protein [Pedobacter hiemivivus]TCC97142.1 DUF1223 domain-containing protein [Pedobacter hiemivivus]